LIPDRRGPQKNEVLVEAQNLAITLIKGGHLIDGTGKPPKGQAVLLVENERITAVGAQAENRAAEASDVIDCGSRTLLPGLIDCHNHLSLDPTLDNYLYRMNDPIPDLTLRAVATMRVDVQSGVTTSRCLGDKEFLDTACREWVREGRVPGPRLLVAGRGIRAPHGHGFVGYPFGGVEAVRQAVRENLLAGVDLIKIYITGTLRSKEGILHYFSKEEIEAAVEEAHRVGVPVATHCIGGPGLKLALDAGIDVIEHGYFVSDEDIERLGQSGTWLVMTPSIFLTDARIKTLPPHLIEGHLQQRDEVVKRMAAAISGGVRYAVGTDGMHGGLAQEIQYLVDFGASPADALRAATASAARVCGMEDHIGTLEKGKFADVLAVEGDPLKDPLVLQGSKTVILGGRRVK
jgi:imidazolonepropionase-like amidohydrolase